MTSPTQGMTKERAGYALSKIRKIARLPVRGMRARSIVYGAKKLLKNQKQNAKAPLEVTRETKRLV